VLRDHHIGTVTRALGTAMARDVINGPAFPTLTQTLAVLEKAGQDPVQTLRRAAMRHELETAESVAKVLNHRLELVTANVDASSPVATTDPTPPRRTCSVSAVPGREPDTDVAARRRDGGRPRRERCVHNCRGASGDNLRSG
jgi:hypothetical protein